MRSSRHFLTAAVAGLAGVLALPALAADGKALFTDKGCVACHGEDAKTPLQEGFPRLAGQNADYILLQLKDIKGGVRTNGQSVDTMKPVLDEMTEAEFSAIAGYLAGLPKPVPATAAGAEGPGKKLYMTKTCVACHGKDGNKPILKTYPFVAGQDKAYIIQQMKDIKSGARKNVGTQAMQPVMHLVTEQDIEAIAEYLANVK